MKHSIYALLVLNLCLAYLRASNSVFKIGNLLPEIIVKKDFDPTTNNYFNRSRPFDFNNYVYELKNSNQLSTVVNAINFASQALSKLFRDIYKCDFDLNPANTKVRFFKICKRIWEHLDCLFFLKFSFIENKFRVIKNYFHAEGDFHVNY